MGNLNIGFAQAVLSSKVLNNWSASLKATFKITADQGYLNQRGEKKFKKWQGNFLVTADSSPISSVQSHPAEP